MSYSIQSPCFNCEKKDTCTDAATINKAVQEEIHSRTYAEGHQGGGTIVLACCRQKSIS